MNKYSIDDIIDNLDKLDDYDRTNNDTEQNSIKIAKYVLQQMNKNTYFIIENFKVKQLINKKDEDKII